MRHISKNGLKLHDTITLGKSLVAETNNNGGNNNDAVECGDYYEDDGYYVRLTCRATQIFIMWCVGCRSKSS